MPIYTIKLINCQEVANQTFIFTFEKPDKFTFIPGQYGGFTLINPSEKDAGGITRRFSIASAPDDPFLCIAIRMQDSAYKRVLRTLALGSEIKLAGPTGTFILHEEVTIPAVFIAGGIGITPFYSMIQHATRHQSKQKITLFYGNQTIKDAAFLSKLLQLEQQNPAFKLIATLVNPELTWTSETGFITSAMIEKYITNLFDPFYYICGSPVMVTTLQETLAEMGIDEDRIRVEDFPGY